MCTEHQEERPLIVIKHLHSKCKAPRTCLDVVQGLHGFPAALARPQDSGPQAGRHLPGLVLHQRHQGRNDDRDARKHERWELVAERLARACIGVFRGRSALDAQW